MTGSRVWRVTSADVALLRDRIYDPDRTLPLVVISPASDTGLARVAPQRVLDELNKEGVKAEVAVLADMSASQSLSYLERNIAVYGGAIRIVAPGAQPSDHWRLHPIVFAYADDDESSVLVGIRSETAAVARRPPRTPPAPTPRPVVTARPGPHLFRNSPATPTQPLPEHPDQPVNVTEDEPAPSEPAVVPPSQPTPTEPPAAAAVLPAAWLAHVDQRLADAEHSIVANLTDTLIELIGGATSHDLARERSRADTAEQELEALRAHHQQQRERAEQDARDLIPAVWDDPERQLRWEIEQAWLTGAPEADRQPLRAFTFADGFLSSMTAHIVPRSKTITIMVDVLTGDVWDRRTCHQWWESGSSGPARTSPQGGVGWRVWVKANSPGAPRLHWFEQPDRTVLFAQVGHHDSAI